MIDAAAAIFAEQGFEATTFAQIAERSGVSIAYLQGLGTKPQIFRFALDRRATGGADSLVDAADGLIAAGPELSPPEALELLVVTTASWNAGSHRLWRAWSQSSDPELRADWDATMASARGAYRTWLDALEAQGARRPDLPIEEQAAELWLLTLAEAYDLLVRVAGLSHEQYLAWLRRSLVELVLKPGS